MNGEGVNIVNLHMKNSITAKLIKQSGIKKLQFPVSADCQNALPNSLVSPG
jgi:hypothetical protein